VAGFLRIRKAEVETHHEESIAHTDDGGQSPARPGPSPNLLTLKEIRNSAALAPRKPCARAQKEPVDGHRGGARPGCAMMGTGDLDERR
jgi:hypothetical protein